MRSSPALVRAVVAGLGAILIVASTSSGPPVRAAGPPAVLCVIDEAIGSPLGTDCEQATPAGVAANADAGSPPAAAQARTDGDVIPDVIVAKFRPGARPAEVDALLESHELTTLRSIPALRVRTLRVDPARRERTIVELERAPIVARAEEDLVARLADVTPNDDAWTDQWGARLVRAPAAWEVTHGVPTVLVAVLDTGVDARHADLQGAFTGGYDVIDGDADPSDRHGHGTAVAGVIAARGNNREGQAGLCWTCTLVPIRVLGVDGMGTTSTVAAGIVRAVDAGARVINLSLGSGSSTETLDEAVAYAIGHDRLVVAAAGNDGQPGALYPAAHPGVLSVAGTNQADQLYRWSNYGASVRLAAPGCNPAPLVGGGYVEFCGTSAAAPVVAGIAALALSVNPKLSSGQVADAIRRSAVPVPGVEFGRVDAARTIQAVVPAAARFAADGRSRAGKVRAFRLTVGPGPLEATVRITAKRAAVRLELYTAGGVRVATATGRRSLRLHRVVTGGAYSVRLRASEATRFAITVTYTPPIP
jgi:subtilisin family serine protease